mgnify:CR=1 FL=1|jgi:hypothetical protein
MNAIQKVVGSYKAMKYCLKVCREVEHSMLGMTIVDDLGLVVFGKHCL